MGKSVRTVLLSVSATLAIAMFIMLWAVRPASESAVLDEARARQDQGLLEISRPLETDLQAISDAEALSEEAMEIILSDEDFIARLAEAMVANQSLRDAITAELGPEVATLAVDAMVGFIEDNRAEFDRIIGEEIVSYVAANYDAGIESVNGEIEGRMAELADTFTSLVDAEIQAYLDANTETLVNLINSELEAYASENSDELAELVRSEIATATIDKNALVEILVEPLTQAVYDEIVSFVEKVDVEAIMSEVEKQISQALDDNLSAANAYTDEAIGSVLGLTSVYTEELARKIIDEVVAKVVEEIKEQGYTTLAIGVPGPPSAITAIVTIPNF